MKSLVLILLFGFTFVGCEKKKVSTQEISYNRQSVEEKDTLVNKTFYSYKQSSEGSEIVLSYFRQKLSIEKIHIEELGSLGKSEIEYKFKNDSLIYKKVIFYYDKPFYENDFKIIDTCYIKCFFLNDKIYNLILSSSCEGKTTIDLEKKLLKEKRYYLDYWYKYKDSLTR